MAEVRGGFPNTELWSELPPEQRMPRRRGCLGREVIAAAQAVQEAGADGLLLIKALSAYSHLDRRKYVWHNASPTF